MDKGGAKVLIVILVLLIIVAGGVLGYKIMNDKQDVEEVVQEEASVPQEEPKKEVQIYKRRR